jgi:hypothetical protein
MQGICRTRTQSLCGTRWIPCFPCYTSYPRSQRKQVYTYVVRNRCTMFTKCLLIQTSSSVILPADLQTFESYACRIRHIHLSSFKEKVSNHIYSSITPTKIYVFSPLSDVSLSVRSTPSWRKTLSSFLSSRRRPPFPRLRYIMSQTPSKSTWPHSYMRLLICIPIRQSIQFHPFIW